MLESKYNIININIYVNKNNIKYVKYKKKTNLLFKINQ